MKPSNDNNYNIIAYMFNRPRYKSKSKIVNGYRATTDFLNNPLRKLPSSVRANPIYNMVVRGSIVLLGLVAFSHLMGGSNYQEPIQTSPMPVIEQPIAKIDTIANLPQPEVINTANLDNSLAKAKAVFDSFPEVDGENPIDRMKRLNKHIIDSKDKNPI